MDSSLGPPLSLSSLGLLQSKLLGRVIRGNAFTVHHEAHLRWLAEAFSVVCCGWLLGTPGDSIGFCNGFKKCLKVNMHTAWLVRDPSWLSTSTYIYNNDILWWAYILHLHAQLGWDNSIPNPWVDLINDQTASLCLARKHPSSWVYVSRFNAFKLQRNLFAV